jgi:hypothetical protein
MRSQGFPFHLVESRVYITIAADASIQGLGGILVIYGVIAEWFSDAWSDTDHSGFLPRCGDSGNMGLWESMSVFMYVACGERSSQEYSRVLRHSFVVQSIQAGSLAIESRTVLGRTTRLIVSTTKRSSSAHTLCYRSILVFFQNFFFKLYKENFNMWWRVGRRVCPGSGIRLSVNPFTNPSPSSLTEWAAPRGGTTNCKHMFS